MTKTAAPGTALSSTSELAHHLRLWCAGSPGAESEQQLLDFATRVAESANSGRLRAAANAEGITSRSLAMSALAELFTASGPGSPLARSLEACLFDDASSVARFKATVYARIDQFVYRRLEMNDPNGYRITRNLRLAYERNPRLKVGPVGCLSHVTLLEVDDLCADGREWSHDELVSLICRHADHSQRIGDWLVEVLENAFSEAGRQRFVFTEMLEGAFRQADAHLFRQEMLTMSESEPIDPESRRIVAEAVAAASREGHDRLDQYLAKGRIDTSAHARMTLALRDLTADIDGDGAGSVSRFEYVARHWPDLDRKTYDTAVKSPFQSVIELVYQRLVKILREKIR